MILTSDNGDLVKDKDWVKFVDILFMSYDISRIFHKKQRL